jgi:phytol kinase
MQSIPAAAANGPGAAAPALLALLPDAQTLLAVAPLALLYAAAAAAFAGWLRVRRGVRAPYTRKTFHFLILTAAMLVHLGWGVAGVIVFGAVVSLLVLGAVARGSGFAFYEAMARPSDAPRQSLFILVPLATTAVGGVLANLLFPAWAHVGYMVVAWGDAVGEPVGTRWGRHRYRVASLGGVPATRSVEGSAAVALVSAAAAAVALAAVGVPTLQALRAGAAIGLGAAAVEAVSNHGLDNLTLQLAGAGLAWLLLG